MRRSGLAHLRSISGLHVTAGVGFAMLLTMRLLALSPRLALAGIVLPLAAAAGALAGGGYTLLAGAEVPTLRSFIAALLVLIAFLMGREALTLRLVAAGALIGGSEEHTSELQSIMRNSYAGLCLKNKKKREHT